MKRLCIIPARGGSKRIPRKNIRPFLGKPIIAYSVEAALSSGLFDEVMVSTEDEEIAHIAISAGAQVPFLRSKENADDFATTIDVIAEVISAYDQDFAEVCCIYATAPFVTGELLVRANERFSAGDFDCLFPVLPYSFPIQRALRREAEGRTLMFEPENMSVRSQDLERSYHDAGMFYWLLPDRTIPVKKLWTKNTGSIVLSAMEAHDIDEEEDWKVAEFKYKLNKIN